MHNHTPPRHPPIFRTPILPVPFTPIFTTIRLLKIYTSPPPWRALFNSYSTWTPVPPPPPWRRPHAYPFSILKIQPHHLTFSPYPGQLSTPTPARPFLNHGTENFKPSHHSLPTFVFVWTRRNGTQPRLAAYSLYPLEEIPITPSSLNTSHSLLPTLWMHSFPIPRIAPSRTQRRSTPWSPSPSPELFTILTLSRHKN